MYYAYAQFSVKREIGSIFIAKPPYFKDLTGFVTNIIINLKIVHRHNVYLYPDVDFLGVHSQLWVGQYMFVQNHAGKKS